MTADHPSSGSPALPFAQSEAPAIDELFSAREACAECAIGLPPARGEVKEPEGLHLHADGLSHALRARTRRRLPMAHNEARVENRMQRTQRATKESAEQ
eukprot:5231615-Pleurochrysis_carterae.AAC.1